jgi:hypothetical protein
VRLTHVRRSCASVWVVVLVLSCPMRASLGDDNAGWPGRGEVTYVSKGLNIGHKWGTFVLHPGDSGRAIYTFPGEPIREVRVQFVAVFPSSTDPNVLFSVYRETAPNPARQVRQWAFQIDYRTLNGYVIYVKDNESNAWAGGWEIYDFAEKSPEW